MSTTWSESQNMDDLHKRALNGDMVAYDAWAPIYEKSMADMGYKGPQIIADRFVQNLEQENSQLHEKDSLRVLDIGCGTGWVVDAILKTSKMAGRYVFTGADIHQGMLKQAEDKGTYQDLQKIDLNNASLDGKYDVIISSGTFVDGHVRLEKIFDLLDQNLADNGMLIVVARSSVWDPTMTAKLEALGWESHHEHIEGYADNVTAESILIKRK